MGASGQGQGDMSSIRTIDVSSWPLPRRSEQTARPHFGAVLLSVVLVCIAGLASAADAPVPLLEQGRPVDWWFVFKFNGSAFPACGTKTELRVCLFDKKQKPTKYKFGYSQQFVYASSEDPKLTKGSGCAGDSVKDPLGATFDNVYNGSHFYVVWNDQPYGHPKVPHCTSGGNCASPWGHSKGMLAWNEEGEGVVLQVSTPSWPEAASKDFPRKGEANTLGCLGHNNVKLSQHFFALKLTKPDLLKVLSAMQNASVATDPKQRQIVSNGGPEDVQALVSQLGKRVDSKTFTRETLSTGVEIISKPSNLNVPPWQMVSALLGAAPLRTATFWAAPYIPTTTKSTKISCWDDSLGRSGPVQIATTGLWDGVEFGLKGGANHAKIGVTIAGDKHYSIFGDENQQGALTGKCDRSQNGRGGLFFVIEDQTLTEGLSDLMEGDTASTKIPSR